MSANQDVRRVAIVGTGVIGASWAAYYLSRGFEVVATDPGTPAEANLRKYVDDAWGLGELVEVDIRLRQGLRSAACLERSARSTPFARRVLRVSRAGAGFYAPVTRTVRDPS